MNELLSRERRRPDLLRVRRLYEAGGTEEASLMLGRLTADGVGAAYQISDAICSERTFAYIASEVYYVDQMASYLSDPDRRDPHRFILAAVPGLYVSPRPYAYSKARVALQKSACSLMRLHGVPISTHDWAVYRRSDEEDGRVFRASAFERVLSPGDFPPLPTVVREALPSLGVHPLLPYLPKHFAFICADPRHPAYTAVVFNLEREWA